MATVCTAAATATTTTTISSIDSQECFRSTKSSSLDMSFFTFKIQKPKDDMDFEACRFDFRLDAKNGLTPSKRKKSERRGTCYNTLFKCKICGSLFDNRAALLEHKLVHNDHKCPICDVKVARKATLKEHMNVIHGIGKMKDIPMDAQHAQQECPSPSTANGGGKIDQKAALREHLQMVRQLAKKAAQESAKAKPSNQEQNELMDTMPNGGEGLQHPPPEVMRQMQPAFPSNPNDHPMAFPPTPAQADVPPPQAMPLQMPTSMPGYVYINVPVIMSHDHQQRGPKQLPGATAVPGNVPFIPGFQGLPAAFQQQNPRLGASGKLDKSDVQPLPSPLDENDIVKIKPEPSESGTGQTGGMALLHFPVQPNAEDLEPGEIRNMNKANSAARFSSPAATSMGMQLPTMVKVEDYHNNGLSDMKQPIGQQAILQHSNGPYVSINSGVINIHPQHDTSKAQPYMFSEASDFRKQAFISTSFTADEDDDNCVVDLSMDNTKSEAALAEQLSLGSTTFSNVPTLDYMGDNSQQSSDYVLDLSSKKSVSEPEMRLDPMQIDQQQGKEPVTLPISPRPSSVASSASECSIAKSAKKPKSGGLNSMVAKLWQTKIKKTQEDKDVSSSVGTMEAVNGDGSEQNPITLSELDDAPAPQPPPPLQESPIEDAQSQHSRAKLELLRCVELRATNLALDKHKSSGANPDQQPTRKTRRKRAKVDYCCITYHSCRVCKQLFESADAMWDHALQHADFYNERCDYCDFSAPCKDMVQKHCVEAHGVPTGKDETTRTRSEGKNKEYPCKVCGKCLRSPAGLQVHMVRHDEAAERQYTCDVKDCQATFTNQRDCLSHRTRVHKNENSTQRRYQCPHEGCTKNYAKRDGLKHHLMSHTGERPLACNYPGCKKTFREAKHLKIHRLRHTDEKPMQCKLCDYACRQRTSMNWHMKTRHGLEKSCTADNRTIYMNSNTVVIESCESGTAINTNGDSTVYMEEEVMYQNSGMAMEELETEDEIESPVPSSTDESCAEDSSETLITGVATPGALNLSMSLQLASKPDVKDIKPAKLPVHPASLPTAFPGLPAETSVNCNPIHAPETKFHSCTICKQLFENVEKMWSHRLIEHDDILKFYCDVCGFTSDMVDDFRTHMRNDHGRELVEVKEFVCLWCGHEYSSRHNLKQHLLLKHAGDASPSYPCPYDNCENKALGKQALKLHIQRRHFKAQQEAAMSAAAAAAAATAAAAAASASMNNVSSELQCPADGCNRTFDTVSALTNHQLTHSEERPLVCDFQGCDKTFREAKHLKVHKMLHTDERPLKCLQCHYSCRQRNSMNWHMKSKHSMQKQVSADGRTIYVPM